MSSYSYKGDNQLTLVLAQEAAQAIAWPATLNLGKSCKRSLLHPEAQEGRHITTSIKLAGAMIMHTKGLDITLTHYLPNVC